MAIFVTLLAMATDIFDYFGFQGSYQHSLRSTAG
jgi:hypothetical protein